ncbi:MAG: glycerophosphodiester phosphodiesterase [Lutibacter sp.]|jgi:glycerophosphoryl diester phosphodiesterase|nr:glycerophosphodiester phosphodiesterase [Lutibacter sp.]
MKQTIKSSKVLLFLVLSITSLQAQVMVIGHRGAKGHLPENTLPSIQKAIELGVDAVEIDVFRCKTGEIVVFHDDTVDKLTDGNGAIENMTLTEIQALKVLEKGRIPTLEAVMRLIKGRVLLNIELKGRQTAEGTHALIEKMLTSHLWTADRFIISSFDWEELSIFRKISPDMALAVLTDKDPLQALDFAWAVQAIAINPNYTDLNEEKVRKIHKAGFKVYPWTVNQPAAIKRMIELGVDGIFSDFPERILQKTP